MEAVAELNPVCGGVVALYGGFQGHAVASVESCCEFKVAHGFDVLMLELKVSGGDFEKLTASTHIANTLDVIVVALFKKVYFVLNNEPQIRNRFVREAIE